MYVCAYLLWEDILVIYTSTNTQICNACVWAGIYLCDYIYTYIPFTNPSARAGYDTRSIFKRSFPSPRLVASPRLKNLVYPTIYL